jgi:hypothetical protein
VKGVRTEQLPSDVSIDPSVYSTLPFAPVQGLECSTMPGSSTARTSCAFAPHTACASTGVLLVEGSAVFPSQSRRLPLLPTIQSPPRIADDQVLVPTFGDSVFEFTL